MSMTGPMTWTTLPVRAVVAVCAICFFVTTKVAKITKALCPSCSSWFLSRRRARDDLDDLARDCRLTDLVHVERQVLDHVRRVPRRRVHRRHLCREERRVRLEQGAVDLHLHVTRQQRVEDALRTRLVQIVGLRSVRRRLLNSWTWQT